MHTIIQPRPSTGTRHAKLAEPPSPGYERLASVLIALSLILAALVGCLLLIWLGLRTLAKPVPVAVEFQLPGGVSRGFAGTPLQIDGPLEDQLAQQADAQQQSLEQRVALVGATLSEQRFELDELFTTDQSEAPAGKRVGSPGSPDGDVGVGGPGPFKKSVGSRWVIDFDDACSLEEYARQLDFFQIELGVVGVGGEIHYAERFSREKPVVRLGKSVDEQRIYFSWNRGARQEADRKLLAKAGLTSSGKAIVHLYRDDLVKLISGVELAYLKSKHPKKHPRDIWRTRFVILQRGADYEFVVLEQTCY